MSRQMPLVDMLLCDVELVTVEVDAHFTHFFGLVEFRQH